MKIIFLDVDGVLNCRNSRSRCGSIIGVDRAKVERLAKIINETGAKVVLTSTWRNGLDDNLEATDKYGKYLIKALRVYGEIEIFGKTEYINVWDRGNEITEWLDRHKDVESWVVLDDEVFRDYSMTGVSKRLVKTSWYKDGLTDEHVERAIELLNEKEVI